MVFTRAVGESGSSPLTRGKPCAVLGVGSEGRLIPAHAGKTRAPPGRTRQRTAHPRSRGENQAGLDASLRAGGSSPLTRGKRRRRARSEDGGRLIPSHAGKTPPPRPFGPPDPAHPRSRGENSIGATPWCCPEGSSPLTPGKRRRTRSRRSSPGLIPAHAGKTRPCDEGHALTWAHPRSRGENGDRAEAVAAAGGSSPLTRGKLLGGHSPHSLSQAHPRSRGENRSSSVVPFALAGSSPLTRGKPRPGRESSQASRLIPAHAGKTRYGLSSRARDRAHPRSRGENVAVAGTLALVAGSSPLTRGKRGRSREWLSSLGLIPAHAGKTRNAGGLEVPRGAHPRSRGENFARVPVGKTCAGSSPLTRGKPLPCTRNTRTARLIPAHAGKTNSSRITGHMWAAHPRSRGENYAIADLFSRKQGSSPLTRGKRNSFMYTSMSERLIPAHAGKTGGCEVGEEERKAHPRSRGENPRTLLASKHAAGSSPLTRGKLHSKCPGH